MRPLRRKRLGVFGLLPLLVGAVATTPPVWAAAPVVSTFLAVEDATVRADRPTTNYGVSTSLEVDRSPTKRALLKFDVSGIGSDDVISARLRVFCTDSSAVGGVFAAAESAWQEATVTWETAPSGGAVVASLGRVNANSWYEVDLASLISGDGTFSILVTSTSPNGADYASRDAGPSTMPQLVVTHEPIIVDDQPPSQPQGLVADAVMADSVSLSWQAATDNVGVVAHDVFRDGTLIASAGVTQHTDTTVAGDTTYIYSVRARDAAGNVSAPSDPLSLTTPPGYPVLVGAGDIANCLGAGDEATAAQLDVLPGTVFTLGDNAYPVGSAEDFAGCYDPSWGRHRARTMPAAGNHDYASPGANGYFGYFGEAAGDPALGYYAYTRGSWRILVLNSNCGDVGGCQAGSAQELWLQNELTASAGMNVLAYWHHPRFSSGVHGSNATYQDFWLDLYRAGADVVLSGHDHDYERFAPQDSTGTLDIEYGIRQFVVGSGGVGLSGFGTPAPNSEVRDASTFGVLELTLKADSYAWRFLPVSGAFSDVGGALIHDAPPPDINPPSAPDGLVAADVSESQVRLTWNMAADDVRVTGYELVRNGITRGFTTDTQFNDTDVLGSQTYEYMVRARDAWGNVSPFSAPVQVSTPSPPSSLVIALSADTYIRADQPTSNFGLATTIHVDGSPLKQVLFKLTLNGISGASVVSARLRLYCIDSSSFGGDVHLAPTSWDEWAVTWDTAPAADSAVVTSIGAVTSGNWYEVDLSSVITGEGTYGFRITSASSNGADYASRDAGNGLEPTIVLELAP